MEYSTHSVAAALNPEPGKIVQCQCREQVKVFCITGWMQTLGEVCQPCMADQAQAWDAYMHEDSSRVRPPKPNLVAVIGEVITPEVRGAPWAEHEAVAPGTV